MPQPGNPGSLNRYSYVLNNPLKFTDPTGHANEATGGVADLYAWAELLDHSHSQKFHGWLHERDSAWANYLIAKREGAPPEVVSAAADMLEARQSALLINGYHGVATAGQTAFQSYGVDVGTGIIGLAGGVTSIGVVGLKAAPVQAGEAGGYAELKNRGAFGDDLEAHHMPQKALGFTSPDEGGALMLPKNEHAQTRTYGQRGALTVSQDAGNRFEKCWLRIFGTFGRSLVRDTTRVCKI